MFVDAANAKGGKVAALCLPGGSAMFARKELDDLATFAAIYGAKGLAYIKVNDASKLNADGLQSPIVKFLSEQTLVKIIAATNAKTGDIIFFCADKTKVVYDTLGALRTKLGHAKGFAEGGYKPVWVVDFPASAKIIGNRCE